MSSALNVVIELRRKNLEQKREINELKRSIKSKDQLIKELEQELNEMSNMVISNTNKMISNNRLKRLRKQTNFVTNKIPLTTLNNLKQTNVNVFDKSFTLIENKHKINKPEDYVIYPHTNINDKVPEKIYYIHRNALKKHLNASTNPNRNPSANPFYQHAVSRMTFLPIDLKRSLKRLENSLNR